MIAIAHAALAITTALFDSLWEGALIAGALWLGLRCLPKLDAATRYAIWLCALAALVLIPALTVSLPVQTSESPMIDAARSSEKSSVFIAPPTQPQRNTAWTTPEPTGVVSESAPAAFHKSQITIPQTLAVVIALIWMAAACARGLQFLLDVRALVAIRRDAWLYSAAHEYPIFLSRCVQVPLASGFLRGAVILPASLVERLRSDAVDAIIIHEVAHLRRYDVWTNALARMVEAVVALNPAAWFVMRRLSMEREIRATIGSSLGPAQAMRSRAHWQQWQLVRALACRSLPQARSAPVTQSSCASSVSWTRVRDVCVFHRRHSEARSCCSHSSH